MTNVILGGGISGLSAAYYLAKSTKNKIKIYESSQRLGGWIRTSRQENGTLFEHGPRTLRCGGAAADNTLELVKELGLSSSIRPVLRSSPAARNRMIYFNNQLISLPNTWTALFKINPPFIPPFARAIINDLMTPKKTVPDESIYDFVARRFGKAYAEIPLSAMICGIFAGDAKEISVKALMSSLFEMEQNHGSVLKGSYHKMKESFGKKTKAKKSVESKKWSVWSLQNGLETLPNTLTNHLSEKDNVKIYLEKKCSKVDFKDGKVLLTIDGQTEQADHLHSTVPCKDLALVLGDDHSFLKKELSAIPFVSVAIVALEYEGDFIQNKGFGFLVPPNQNLPILGIVFDSCIFPQDGKTVLTVMMGGRWFVKHFGTDPDQDLILKIANDYVKSILRIDKKPSQILVSVNKDCIPQYLVGHSERVSRMRAYIKEHNLPLTLIGNSYDGIGVNDAILSAKTWIERTSNMSSDTKQ